MSKIMTTLKQRPVIWNKLKVALPTISQVMCNSDRGHLRATKEYKDYRKDLRSLRIDLFKEHRHKLEMMSESYGGQAAEEARKERDREERALKANEKELERMAALRAVHEQREQRRTERRVLRGKEARMKFEEDLKEQRKREVLKVVEESKNFITIENLDAKIEEALETEVSYNYAMSLKGELIKDDPTLPPELASLTRDSSESQPSVNVTES